MIVQNQKNSIRTPKNVPYSGTTSIEGKEVHMSSRKHQLKFIEFTIVL